MERGCNPAVVAIRLGRVAAEGLRTERYPRLVPCLHRASMTTAHDSDREREALSPASWSLTVLSALADSVAPSRISVTIILFSSDKRPDGVRDPCWPPGRRRRSLLPPVATA